MDISLTAKYELNDIVYTIERNGRNFEPSLPMIVNEIRLRITQYGTYIICHLIDGGLTIDFYEKDCYKTYEECLEVCKQMNEEKV